MKEITNLYRVSTQRRYKKVYKKEMSTERKVRLNKIGFVWNAAMAAHRESQMKLPILYVVVVGAFLFWWLRRVKPKLPPPS